MEEWIHETIYAIGFLTIIAGVFFFFVFREGDKRSKIDYYRELLKAGHLTNEFEAFWGAHSNYSYEQALCKFFTPERESEALREKKYWDKSVQENEDKLHKELIKNRVFAYDFEKFIFGLYAPLAEKKDGVWRIEDAALPYDYVYDAFLEYYTGTSKENQKTFEELISRHILDKSHQDPNNLEVGAVLTLHANIISETDLNIDRWISSEEQKDH